VTLMTHFADADGKLGRALAAGRFEAMAKGLELPAQPCNSAAIMRYPEAHSGLGEAGHHALRLLAVSRSKRGSPRLKPVMTLSSELIAVKELRRGDSVGYGCTFTADAPMRIGIVALRLRRWLSAPRAHRTPIVVCGKHTRTVGRVAMDMLFADLGPVPEAAAGSPVTAVGRGTVRRRSRGERGYRELRAPVRAVAARAR